jgi:hemin uptake protein HemP
MEKTVNRISELARHESVARAAPDDGAGDELVPLRRVESAWLFVRGREVIIVHRGQEYRLRITKSDKLILTK